MEIITRNVPVNKKHMTATIDATNSKVIYIVDPDGTVQAIPLPPYGLLELAIQNHNVGNLSYRITLKR